MNSTMPGAMSGYAARPFDIKRPGSGPGAIRERAYPSAIWSIVGRLRLSTDERQGSASYHNPKMQEC